MNAADQVKRELRDGLTSAMKDRRVDAITVLRSALAAIDNAEAISTDSLGDPGAGRNPLGESFGATEVPRRTLDAGELAEILRAECDGRLRAAEHYDLHGRGAEAERMKREAAALAGYVEIAVARAQQADS